MAESEASIVAAISASVCASETKNFSWAFTTPRSSNSSVKRSRNAASAGRVGGEVTEALESWQVARREGAKAAGREGDKTGAELRRWLGDLVATLSWSELGHSEQ